MRSARSRERTSKVALCAPRAAWTSPFPENTASIERRLLLLRRPPQKRIVTRMYNEILVVIIVGIIRLQKARTRRTRYAYMSTKIPLSLSACLSITVRLLSLSMHDQIRHIYLPVCIRHRDRRILLHTTVQRSICSIMYNPLSSLSIC